MAQLKALKECYEDSYHSLYRQALAMVGSPEAAADIVQEVFAKTTATIAQGTEIKNLGGWLNRCVHNVSVNHTEEKPSQPFQENFDLVDINSPFELVHAKQRCDDMCQAIDRLAPAQRSAFLLAEIKGLEYKEIAATLKRSEDSVRQLLARARRHIREAVGPDVTSFASPLIRLKAQGLHSDKNRVQTLRDHVAVKFSHFQESVASIMQRSMEVGAHPVAALVTGALIVVGLGQPLTAERLAGQNGAPMVGPLQPPMSPKQRVTPTSDNASAIDKSTPLRSIVPDGIRGTSNAHPDELAQLGPRSERTRRSTEDGGATDSSRRPGRNSGDTASNRDHTDDSDSENLCGEIRLVSAPPIQCSPDGPSGGKGSVSEGNNRFVVTGDDEDEATCGESACLGTVDIACTEPERLEAQVTENRCTSDDSETEATSYSPGENTALDEPNLDVSLNELDRDGASDDTGSDTGSTVTFEDPGLSTI